jgi:hypothetical protein
MDPSSREDEKSQTVRGPEYVTVQLFEEEVAGASSSPFVVPPLPGGEAPGAARSAGAGLTWLAEEEVTTIELNRVALAEALAHARSASAAPPGAARSVQGAQTAALVLAAAAQILASAAAPGAPAPAAPTAAAPGSSWRRNVWLTATFAAGLGLGALFLGAWGGSFRGWLGRVAEVPFRAPASPAVAGVPAAAPVAAVAPEPPQPPHAEPPAVSVRRPALATDEEVAAAAAAPYVDAPSRPAPAHRRHGGAAKADNIVKIDELVLAIPDLPAP